MSGSGAGLPATGFAARWCGTGLGAYRARSGTYTYYPYETLPPLDSIPFAGAFQWCGGTGATVPEQVAAMGRLADDLAARNLSLPQDFVTFQSDSKLRFSLAEVSATGCYTSISAPLPSPTEPGAFLVRFLRDQQDCVLWYLYLRPSGEAFVVHSSVDYEYEYRARADGAETGTDLDDPEEQRAAIFRCAPSFEEFACRFWIENRLWYALSDGGPSELEDALVSDYLRHYAPSSGAPARQRRDRRRARVAERVRPGGGGEDRDRPMTPLPRTLAEARAAEAAGERLRWLFFWGHRPPRGGGIGPGCLSQWWEAEFTADGHTFRTAEHYMMFHKALLFGDEAAAKAILDADHPGAAKALGRQVRDFDETLWREQRYGIVVRGSLAKFGQHPPLRGFLLATRDRVLVEASPLDRIWGIGLAADDEQAASPAAWRGRNLLGFALMDARDALAPEAG